MAKIDYEFDHAAGGKPGKGGIYLRLVAIFLLVAGITGGLIWYFWPAQEKETPPVDPGIVTPVTGNGEEEPVTEDPAVSPAGPGGKGGRVKTIVDLPVDEEPVAGGATEIKNGDAEPKSGETGPVKSGTEETPTVVPVKGKPWIGDGPDSAGNTPVSAIPVAGLPAWDKKMNDLDALMEAKKYAEVIPLCRELLATEGVIPNSGEYREIAKALTEANLAVMAGNVPAPEIVTHAVTGGESYSALASRYHTTIGAIKSLNRIPAGDNNLLVGRKMKIYPGPWSIKVEKGAKLLKLYNNGALFALFDIGIGRLGKTPTAAFVVSVKVNKPDWYSPDGGVVKYGDPDNPLGEYFLKLAATGTPDRPLSGFGIHGTRDDSDVTRSLSNGCVRMRNRDVEKLYLFVPARTPVEIVD